MKITLRSLILAAFALALPTISAAAELKLATVDMRKAFEGYWKTKRTEADLKEKATGFEQKFKTMAEDRQKAIETHQKMVGNASDPALSPEEREKRKKLIEVKVIEIREIEQALQQFDRSSRETLNTQRRNVTEKLTAEIRDVISAKSKAAGYTMAFDSSGMSGPFAPIVIYHSGQNDLTEEVLKQLNASAPPETPAVPPKKEGSPTEIKPEPKKEAPNKSDSKEPKKSEPKK
ncbi:MAG: OmpH family outer membrane protein [Pedosphaera sp.]|nr:OmpH family outer membrane protein [Pedosphaera sp.]